MNRDELMVRKGQLQAEIEARRAEIRLINKELDTLARLDTLAAKLGITPADLTAEQAAVLLDLPAPAGSATATVNLAVLTLAE